MVRNYDDNRAGDIVMKKDGNKCEDFVMLRTMTMRMEMIIMTMKQMMVTVTQFLRPRRQYSLLFLASGNQGDASAERVDSVQGGKN